MKSGEKVVAGCLYEDQDDGTITRIKSNPKWAHYIDQNFDGAERELGYWIRTDDCIIAQRIGKETPS
jgi:hypothetical protein